MGGFYHMVNMGLCGQWAAGNLAPVNGGNTNKVGHRMFPLNDFKIAGKLPVGNGFAGFAFFPQACRGIMIHKQIGKQCACSLRALQPLCRFGQRARKMALGRNFGGIGIAKNRRIRLYFMFNTP